MCSNVGRMETVSLIMSYRESRQFSTVAKYKRFVLSSLKIVVVYRLDINILACILGTIDAASWSKHIGLLFGRSYKVY